MENIAIFVIINSTNIVELMFYSPILPYLYEEVYKLVIQ